MKDNLDIVFHILEDTDNVGEKSLFFYNNPQARLQFLNEIISFSIHRTDSSHDPIHIDKRRQQIIEWIDSRYQEYAWPAHETHFHTSFMQHCGCPFTCLNEISTIIEKLMRNKFAS
jgi:hypothetical protein